jgi:hypothetical protein
MTNLSKIVHGENSDEGYTLVEFPYGKSTDRIFLPPYKFDLIDIFSNRRTYPIPPLAHGVAALNGTIEILKNRGIYSCGRWGLHAYDNMDVVIEKCIELAKEIQ